MNKQDFETYLKMYGPFEIKQIKKLIHRLNDESKCMMVLDVMIDKYSTTLPL